MNACMYLFSLSSTATKRHVPPTTNSIPPPSNCWPKSIHKGQRLSLVTQRNRSAKKKKKVTMLGMAGRQGGSQLTWLSSCLLWMQCFPFVLGEKYPARCCIKAGKRRDLLSFVMVSCRQHQMTWIGHHQEKRFIKNRLSREDNTHTGRWRYTSG